MRIALSLVQLTMLTILFKAGPRQRLLLPQHRGFRPLLQDDKLGAISWLHKDVWHLCCNSKSPKSTGDPLW